MVDTDASKYTVVVTETITYTALVTAHTGEEATALVVSHVLDNRVDQPIDPTQSVDYKDPAGDGRVAVIRVTRAISGMQHSIAPPDARP